MTRKGAHWLICGGVLSMLAALMHIGVIIGGPEWYRFFGAGEAMARADERGEVYPAIATTGIALVLMIWGAYAFSGAGLIRRLPLLRTALVMITAIYLIRGLMVIPIWVAKPHLVTEFDVWSSAIVFVYGAVHLVGLWRAWNALSNNAGRHKV